jgi:autotransporter-associated beta strand protein
MKTILALILLATRLAAFDASSVTSASAFTSESHPGDDSNIKNEAWHISYINNNNWAAYAGFQFGAGVDYGWLEATSNHGTGGTIQLRLGSPTGTLVGSVVIPNTGGWNNYRKFRFALSQTVTGSQDLYLKFVGGGGGLLNVSKFSFGIPNWRSAISADAFAAESHSNNSAIITTSNRKLTNIQNGSWVDYGTIDFGSGLEYVWIEAASVAGGSVEFRTGSPTGTLLGTVAISNTGGSTIYKPFGLKLAQPVSGIQTLFLTFTGGSGNLFDLSKLCFQRLAPDHKPPAPSAPWEYAVLAQDMKSAAAFTSESHPTDGNNVRASNGKVGYIKNDNWIAYANLDLGVDLNSFTILGASGSGGGTVEVRLGSAAGTLIGTLAIPNTQGFDKFQPFTTTLTQTLSGPQNLYFKFTGGGGYLFDLASFRFQSLMPDARSPGRVVAAESFDSESHPDGNPIVATVGGVTSITAESWVKFDNYQFGLESDLLTLEAATAGKGGKVEVRLDSATGPLIGTIPVTFTGSSSHFRPFTTALVQKVSGPQNLVLKFVDTHQTGGDLFNLKSLVIGKKTPIPSAPSVEGSINVYPPVTGLADSPYYSFSVQKVSALNAPLKQNATNWLSSFAWFTECVEPVANVSSAYYEEFIGGWSHTYSNFEMDRNTPIVVKISRKNVVGAPSGPIFMANAHPAHKVISCEIINGDVYVTMKEPALVTVDIDGQLDTRDAPRAIPDVWGGGTNPYNSKANGAHAVSIFANPFIQNKPLPGDPGVRVINPGQPLPEANDDSWTTLYFAPGIHNMSQDANGVERPWQPSDPVALRSGKNYYIPGNTIVYGNFDDRASGNNDAEKNNIHFFGHGTLSLKKVPHFNDYTLPNTGLAIRVANIKKGRNCHFEGITVADPAEFGICIENFEGKEYIAQNSIRWVKSIAWRVNTDVGQMNGGVVEDSFFRHQDDGYYVGDCQIRRSVFWTDVNGTPFNCPGIARSGIPQVDTTFARDVVIEDCDVIYARGMFGFSDGKGFGVISNYFAYDSNTYPDGTANTGQHMVFRNIRVSDPRPARTLFGLNIEPTNTQFLGWAGIRFENIEYRNPQTWGYNNRLIGGPNGAMQKCYFDKVTIADKVMNAALVADATAFETNFQTDLLFTSLSTPPASIYNFLSYGANGTITSTPAGKIQALDTVITVSAEGAPGYRFLSWGGDLAGLVQPASVTMDGHKSVIANFSVAPRNTTIDTTGGTTVLNYDSPQNTYIGNGTLRLSSDGSPERNLNLATSGGDNPTAFAMTGGQIIIDSGVSLINGGWSMGIWTNNLSNMQINGVMDLWDGQPVRVNALTGSGSVNFSNPWGGSARQIHVGIGGGSGTFSGSIEGIHPVAGTFIRLEKYGAGTQRFDNIANQKPKEIIIHQGAVELLTDANITCPADLSGAGNLVKSGTGILILSGNLANTGSISVTQGTLNLTGVLNEQANLVVAADALLDLGFLGAITVNSLQLGTSGSLPPGIYGKDHPTFGSFFTSGSGTLRIAGTNYQVWAGTYAVGAGGVDFDSDGVSNLLEYVLGGNPRESGTHILPTAKQEGAHLVVSFKRTDASEQDVIVAGEWSSNLEVWSGADVTLELANENGSDADDILVKIPLTKMQNGKLFGRIKAISN